MFLRNLFVSKEAIKKLHSNIIQEICNAPKPTGDDPYDYDLALNLMIKNHNQLCERLIKELCQLSAKAVNLQDETGSTLLHWVSRRGNDALALVLIRLRANPLIENHDKLTPLHHAIQMNYRSTLYTICRGDIFFIRNPFNSDNLDDYLLFALSCSANWDMIYQINQFSAVPKSSSDLITFFLSNKYSQAATAASDIIQQYASDNSPLATSSKAQATLKIDGIIEKAHTFKNPVTIEEFKLALESESLDRSYPNIIDRFIIENGAHVLNQNIIEVKTPERHQYEFHLRQMGNKIFWPFLKHDIKQAKDAIRDGMDVGIYMPAVTPLAWAIKHRNIGTIEQLITAGADIKKHVFVDIFVYELPDNPTEPLLLNLIKDKSLANDNSIIRLLLANGAQYNDPDIIKAASDHSISCITEKILTEARNPEYISMRQILFNHLIAKSSQCIVREENDTDDSYKNKIELERLLLLLAHMRTTNFLMTWHQNCDINETSNGKTILSILINRCDSLILDDYLVTAIKIITKYSKIDLRKPVPDLNGLSPLDFVNRENFKNNKVREIINTASINQINKLIVNPRNRMHHLPRDIVTYLIMPFFTKQDPYIANRENNKISEAQRAAMSPKFS